MNTYAGVYCPLKEAGVITSVVCCVVILCDFDCMFIAILTATVGA